MKFPKVAPWIGAALLLVACSGGGSSNPAQIGAVPAAPSLQQVSGTLTIGFVSAAGTLSVARGRAPKYVSSGTTHAYVFINGSATPNNASSTCSGAGTTGTGTFCTLSWTASVAVPGSYFFGVETTDGTNVLAEGGNTFALVAGNNTLATLTLNGVVAKASFATTSCSNALLPGYCDGTVTLQDADGYAIAYTGSATVPTIGNSPSTGTVFDNGNVTFGASSASGLVTGTAQSSGGNVYSTYASNVLTVQGVNTTGAYTYRVQCATASTTGTFGITVAGGTSPSGAVTGAERTSEGSPTYPSGVSTVPTAPSYNCTSGAIASATGTLPIN